jgi:hypothetical protein
VIWQERRRQDYAHTGHSLAGDGSDVAEPEGTGTTKWLGQAVDPPPKADWQNGVWRPRFQSGMAIVDPTGKGARAITVEAGHRKLSGTQTQVRSVNNGQAATTATVADRDGILLVKSP